MTELETRAQPDAPTATTTEAVWRPWRVAPTSGFEVADATGRVGLVQIDRKQFLVEHPFRFADEAVLAKLEARLVAKGRSPEEARRAIDDARTFTPSDENPTDLASVPRYMRWFEGSYGAHTLAAIIHDDLIQNDPNCPPLEDDTLSDRFFREMMRSAGVPWLKRWIMWTAVALRSRWAVGGSRRFSVIVWLVLSVIGITSFVAALGAAVLGWDIPIDTMPLLTFALVLPFGASALWGRQYGAGLVAAVAGLWILPAAALAGLGYVVYLVLERIARAIGLD
jgi:hypothetical protein